MDRIVRPEILDNTLRHKHQCSNYAERQQYPQAATNKINPEIADGLHLPPSHAANQCDGKRNARRSRREVVIRKASHLCEITHGAFATVCLPVGIGCERGCRVERQMRWIHTYEFLRI